MTDTAALPRRTIEPEAVSQAVARRHAGQFALHLAFAIACLATLFPLLWMLRTAFAPSHDVFRATLSLWPDDATLDNFAAASGCILSARGS